MIVNHSDQRPDGYKFHADCMTCGAWSGYFSTKLEQATWAETHACLPKTPERVTLDASYEENYLVDPGGFDWQDFFDKIIDDPHKDD